MGNLLVELLQPFGQVPQVNKPGEDLGFDLFSAEDAVFTYGCPLKVHTGIALHYQTNWLDRFLFGPYGLILKERSGLALKGFRVRGGVIDASYDGEIVVIMTAPVTYGFRGLGGVIKRDSPAQMLPKGTKIAQAIPVRVRTGGKIQKVESVRHARGFGDRGAAGFGSSGA